jgi:hypothetical protein
MSGNLKNFYYKKLDLYLSDSDYWDFYLASDETCLTMYDDIISGSCLVAHYDFNDSNIFSTGSTSADTIYSLTTWEDAINNGVSASTWGFTGIDNGQIPFEIPSIGNESLLSALTASTLVIPSGDTRLVLNRVTGNTVNEVELIENGTFGNGLNDWTGSTGSTWGIIYVPSHIDPIYNQLYITQVVGPPAPLSATLSQSLLLSGGKSYLCTFDIESINGTIEVMSNLSGYSETITGTGKQSVVIDLTDYTGSTNEFTFTLSGFESINTVINSISLLTYEPVYIYPIEQISDSGTTGDYARLCGGFYQGYYKLDGEDYEVLPNRVAKGLTAEFILRKSDLNCSGYTGTTLNDTYPENKGFFWYLGTRAENKFWNQFEGNNTGCTSGCTSDTGCTGTSTTYCTSPKETDIYYLDDESGLMLPLSPPPINVNELNNEFLIYGRAEGTKSLNNEPDGVFGRKTVCDDVDDLFYTSYTETVTDDRNKFITFCRGCNTSCGGCGEALTGTCLTTCTWTGGTEINMELDPNLDIFDNALGFRIKDDGSIGYRSLIFTGYCVDEVYTTGVTVQEEYSLSGMVSDDEWTKISIRFVMNETYDECELEVGPRRKGKLMFYVNCRLKFVSKEIDEFIARRLIEQNEKQLMTFDGQDPDDLGMLIEQNYAGTFIGDISQFRLYNCNLSWCDLKNNCNFDDERYDL